MNVPVSQPSLLYPSWNEQIPLLDDLALMNQQPETKSTIAPINFQCKD
jgi:hypothetical protein